MNNNDFSITLTPEKDIIYSGFKLHKNGLQALGEPTFEQWQEVGEFIKKSNGAVHFWIGDWLNYGEQKWGEMYSQVLDETGFDYGTLRNDKYIAQNIDLSRRRDNIPFGLYQELAPLTPEEQDVLLDRIENEKWTLKELRKEKHRALIDTKRPNIKLDDHLILGDSLKELWTIPDESIDCVVTDPPYGINFQSNHRTATESFEKIKNDKTEAFRLLDGVCEILHRKVKPSSHLYFFTSWKVYPKFVQVIENYFDINNAIVWVKNNWSMGDLEGNYAEQHELIIFASKGRRILNGSRPSNVIHYDRVSNLLHPTEKPIGLIEQLIKNSTQENEIILDPFMGVGSTCIAAKNAGRRYWGIEFDKQYFDIAQRRIQNGD